jgi:leucyl aminopeptidase
MAERAPVEIVKLAAVRTGTVIALTDKSLKLGPAALKLDNGKTVSRALKAAKFVGAVLKSMEILAPAGGSLDRLVLVGLGDPAEMKAHDWLRLGGAIGGRLPGEGDTTILLERPDGEAITGDQAAAVALGIEMRRYKFDKYKTTKNDEAKSGPGAKPGPKPKPGKVRLGIADTRAAKRAWANQSAVLGGVTLARDLVNEPANALGPTEFAARLRTLSKLGVDIKVLDEKALARQKMGALLGVAQGSVRKPFVVVMTWKGGKAGNKPIAFVGKGVVFDTGGISMKPAGGMQDMKGDMGGAAAVSGLMHALAARKAKANVIGIVGLVENMPDANAQRPGDIVTSMSGKTIEVLNTDAEGRLVLADILTYIQKNAKPKVIVDLATLTGAIIVALGHHHAGLFSNNDDLAVALAQAGQMTGEKVWRLPLDPEYDKLIDSKNADIKNIGGRWAGSITAAQFLQRFIEDDTPWAHLDIAGTAMGSPSSETNKSWGSGFGVRLLDELVRENYES